MTQKVYRTAQGRMVDIGALMLQNENTRAVGNMNVNSRGDLLDSNNTPIDTRNNQVAKQYNKQTTNVKNDRVVSSKNSIPKKPAPSVAIIDAPAPPEDFDDNFVKSELAPVEAKPESGGLAAAIARAREVRQETLPPLRGPGAGIKRI